jgi:hypothetical protein
MREAVELAARRDGRTASELARWWLMQRLIKEGYLPEIDSGGKR